MRAYYSDTIKNFLEEETNSILGKLTSAHSHRHLEIQQTNAWKIQIDILKSVFKNDSEGHIFFDLKEDDLLKSEIINNRTYWSFSSKHEEFRNFILK